MFLAAIFCLALGAPPAHGAPAAQVDEVGSDGEPSSAVFDAPFDASPAALLVAAQAIDPPPETGAYILLEENRVELHDDGTYVETYLEVYRIVTEDAVETWSTLQALWAPWQEERPGVRARVVTRDGKAHDIDPRTLSESEAGQTSPGVFSDRKTITGPLPAVAVGAVVVVEVRSSGRRAAWDAGEQRRWTLGAWEPVRLSRFELRTPRAMPVKTRVRGMTLKPVTRMDGDTRVTLYEARDLAGLRKIEANLAFDEPRVPQVLVSTASSWNDVARAYATVVDPLLPPMPPVPPVPPVPPRPLVSFAQPSVGRVAAAQKIVDEVQSVVRYTGLELGEAAVVPRAPKETLKRRYGDCKDLSTLVIARLREAQIPASLAVLRAGDGEDVAADMPGLQSFDHAVVYVPGKPALWIDVTEAHAVVGQTAEALQGRSALIVDAGAKALTRIPSSASSENHYVEERDFALAADGPAHVVETSEATGLLRARLVSSYADLPIDKAREQLARYARALYAAPKLDEVNLQLDDKRSPARVRLEMSGAARGLTDSAKAEVLLDPSVVFAWLPSFLRDSDDDDLAGGAKKTPRREHDVQLPLAYSAELRIRIAAPRGFAARALPASSTVRAGSAVISRTFTLDRRGPVEDAAASAPDVIATFRFDSGKERLNPQEAQALRRAIVAFREDTPASIVLDHEGALRFAEGKVKDALAIYEALIRAEPAMPIHAERLSAKLIELGLGDAARRAAQRAVDAAPMRAAAWNALGWALMHDELGRPLHRGYDRAGALAAFARATTLDASDATARSNIAVLREHAADGTRYGAGSELDEAIGIYRKMKRDLKTNDVDDALLIALFYAGRYPEVRTEASAMPPSASRDLLLIEATAATQGGEAAVREAAKLIPDSRRRRDVLRSVLGDLVKLRRYEDAATIGVSGGVPGDADRLRKLKRAEDVPVPTDARGAVRRLLVAAFDETKTVAQASTGLVAARPMRAGTVRSTSTAMAALRTASRASVEQGLSRLFLLDATVAITESSVEGDDKTGYRVEVRTEAAGGVARESWYVVREDGRYVVLTAGADASELAAEALKNLDAGRVDVARAWLERARDAADARDDVEPRRGARGDPLIETLFDKLADKLPSKLPSKLDTASVDELRVVAASAAVLGPFAPNAEHVLDVARARAPDALRPAFATALTRAAIVAGDGKRATLQARELVAAHPLSLTAHRLLRSACRLTADVVCVQEDAATSLGAGVDDGEALEIVADARARAGDFSGAADLLRKVTGRRDAPPTAVNLQGWLALFTPTDVPRAATQVERAAMAAAKSGRGASSSLLHTLAALQAESGRAADALETLGKSIDDDTEATGGDGALRELDWYVVGRVAEGLGLDDDARAAYGRLHASEHENAVSTWQLAARRLRNLSAGAASSPPTDAASR